MKSANTDNIPWKGTVLNHILDACSDIKCVYLFGSRATAKYGADNDIDIAFWADSAVSSLELFLLQERIAGAIGVNVDLIQLKTVSEVFRFEVVTSAILLYQHSADETNVIEDNIWRAYLYLNDNRKAILNDLLKREAI